MNESLAKTMETILVVDDTAPVLRLVVSILQSAKFNVLQADNGPHAIEVAKNHAGKIDLLLSDVQMGSMNVPDLGLILKASRPDLRIMLMSSMAGGSLLVLNYGWAFIEKPFVKAKLLDMVNAVLHAPNKSQGSSRYDTRDESPD